MFDKRKTKLIFVSQDVEEEDAGIVEVVTDRIPSVLFVRWFDLFCFGFAMCSYILDFFSDIAIAFMHFWAGRNLAGSLILTFALVPSVIINVISMIWMLDDEMHWKRRAHPKRTGTLELNHQRFVSVPRMIGLCVCQMGPLFWYYKAFYYGWQFRNCKADVTSKEKRSYFMRMSEAERDATWLRFFEAFLESAPQMIIQGTIAGKVFINSNGDYPIWLYFQAGSLFLSVVSISWSVVVQNRCLRMTRDDKVNIWPHEAILQFCWRFLTIFARIMTLCAFTLLLDKLWIALVLGCHLLVSMIHIRLLQPVDCSFERILCTLNGFIHLFTPFNMAEGNTRYRYIVAYLFEFMELSIWLFAEKLNNHIPHLTLIRCVVFSFWVTGIVIMIGYYSFFHPNRRQLLGLLSQNDLHEIEAKPSEHAVLVMRDVKLEQKQSAIYPDDNTCHN